MKRAISLLVIFTLLLAVLASCAPKDDTKRLVRLNYYDAGGGLRSWEEYKYDKKGGMIKETYLNPDNSPFSNGGLLSWDKYEYDADGNEIKRTRYDFEGTLLDWTEFEYDDNKIKSSVYNENGSLSSWVEYEYDASGNEIKSNSYGANGALSRTTVSEYDEEGNVIKTAYYDAEGTLSRWTGYEYDGNIIRTAHYDISRYGEFDGLFASEYEYDDDGDVVKVNSYNSDGVLTGWMEYIYEGAS